MKCRPFRVVISVLLMLIGSLFGVLDARAQAGALYFPSTGHHLTDDQGFLTFWRAHDGEHLLGFPISEAAPIGGVPMQYFERGRLEQQTDAAGASYVATGRVGAEYAEALWKQFAPAPPHRPIAGERVFEATGHTLREPFLSFWEAAGGLDFFGAPISEVAWELTTQGRQQVQYFERARLERDPQMTGMPDEVRASTLGRSLAALRGVDTAPIANIGYESYGPPAPAAPDVASLDRAPAPAPPAAAPPPTQPVPARPQAKPQTPEAGSGAKRIVVNLSDQWLYAYEGKLQVFDAPISTGRDGMETPSGSFAIYAKFKIQTMDGVTDGKRWVVPDVPNVMYIIGGVALHGTYWHNRFGTGARLSHGCINLPLDAAAWVYRWAPIGTSVRVTY
jgi:lipoprotein-anchoring transpeptidase ErfK/SrfK